MWWHWIYKTKHVHIVKSTIILHQSFIYISKLISCSAILQHRLVQAKFWAGGRHRRSRCAGVCAETRSIGLVWQSSTQGRHNEVQNIHTWKEVLLQPGRWLVDIVVAHNASCNRSLHQCTLFAVCSQCCVCLWTTLKACTTRKNMRCVVGMLQSYADKGTGRASPRATSGRRIGCGVPALWSVRLSSKGSNLTPTKQTQHWRSVYAIIALIALCLTTCRRENVPGHRYRSDLWFSSCKGAWERHQLSSYSLINHVVPIFCNGTRICRGTSARVNRFRKAWRSIPWPNMNKHVSKLKGLWMSGIHSLDLLAWTVAPVQISSVWLSECSWIGPR